MPDVEVIEFPDAEAAFVAWLRSIAADYPGGFGASVDVEQAPHVRVLRTGGTADLVRDFADITLDVHDTTSARASTLASWIRARVFAAGRAQELGPHHIYEVTAFGAPRRNPDPDNPTVERYSATYTVPFRGTTERSP